MLEDGSTRFGVWLAMKNTTSKTRQILFPAALAFTLGMGCGDNGGESVRSMDDAPGGPAEGANSVANKQPTIPVNIQFSDAGTGAALALTDATSIDYLDKIVDCRSGRTQQAMSASTTKIEVLLGDGGCQFRLEQLTIRGITYDLSSLNKAEEWQAGKSHLLKAEEAADAMFHIQENLPKFISGDAVTVAFSINFAEFNDSVAISRESNAGVTINEKPLIEVELIGQAIVSVHPSRGFGKFRFAFGCTEALSEDGKNCAGQRLDRYRVGLVVNQGQDSLEFCLAKARFGVGSKRLIDPEGSPTWPDNQEAPAALNGGFFTGDLVGPDDMYNQAFGEDKLDHTKLLLMLRSPDNRCRYFPISLLDDM